VSPSDNNGVNASIVASVTRPAGIISHTMRGGSSPFTNSSSVAAGFAPAVAAVSRADPFGS
jgi:hypothetical protein